MTKHTPREMTVSDRSLWGDTPFCSQVRMARIVEHSPMNGMDADHLASEFAKRWNCHEELVAALDQQLSCDAEWARVDPAGFEERKSKADARARAIIAKAKALAI